MVGLISVKKTACFAPGIGTPFSIYYYFTNKDLRSAAEKGLLLIPASVLVLSLSTVVNVPAGLMLVAGAYLYWGMIAMAVGWGFLAMLLIYRAFTGDIIVPRFQIQQKPVTVSEIIAETAESKSNDSYAEIILKEIERLPRERRELILQRMSDVNE